jgi:hypothetical protein
MKGFPAKPISEMEIPGEALQLLAANSNDQCIIKTISIVRKEGEPPRLDLDSSEVEIPKTDEWPNLLASNSPRRRDRNGE